MVTEWTRYAWKNWVPQKKKMQLSIITLKNKSIIIIFKTFQISQDKEHSQLVNVLFSSYHCTTVGLWIGTAHLRSPWTATGCHWRSTQNQLNPLSVNLVMHGRVSKKVTYSHDLREVNCLSPTSAMADK